MALTCFQRALLRVLARNRSPNSVFGGGALNRGRARLNRDTLAANGYPVEERRLAKGIVHAHVSAAGDASLIDWTQDMAWRFSRPLQTGSSAGASTISICR